MRHINVTPRLPTELELPSAKSKMRTNVEKSGKKMSFIFLTAYFVGITSAFLIGYILGIIGGIMFGTGFGNQLFPGTYNLSVPAYGILVCIILAHLYIGDYPRLDMRMHMIWSGALVSIGSVVSVLAIDYYTRGMCVAMGTVLYACGFCFMYQIKLLIMLVRDEVSC
ncbi:hypothetical protein C5167_035314 [Papaver somniferum]|uniref:Uncharacterized protein n=1 Tax=Papaver somniferum TaxID=3469 RepID=A0A4Y7KFJ0_PAPSO|nr:hypothetical protein C5167_035314 [Papaver somniferum]